VSDADPALSFINAVTRHSTVANYGRYVQLRFKNGTRCEALVDSGNEWWTAISKEFALDGALEVAIYNPTAIALHGSSRIASIELRDSSEVRQALAEGPAGPPLKQSPGLRTEARATLEWVQKELRPRLQESDSALTSATEVDEVLTLLDQYASLTPLASLLHLSSAQKY
jgi:hypothetical protein